MGFNEDTGTNVTFAMRNNCEGAVYSSFGVIVFVFVAFFYMSLEQEKQEVQFDEDLQSASDYSININNPPQIEESRNPDEWCKFMEKVTGGHCTFVTIAIDNRRFVKRLIEKRRKLRCLRQIFKNKKMSIEDIEYRVLRASTTSMWDKVMGNCPRAIWDDYLKGEKELEEIAAVSSPRRVTNVFVIFETEEAQRRALDAFSVGKINATFNWSRSFPEELKFHGTILEVSESDEPGSIRWLDLCASDFKRNVGIFTSFLLTAGFIILGAKAILTQRSRGGGFVALCIAILNTITPAICKFIVGYEYRK